MCVPVFAREKGGKGGQRFGLGKFVEGRKDGLYARNR